MQDWKGRTWLLTPMRRTMARPSRSVKCIIAISLSELSLFKDLRGPPGPEISSAPLSPVEKHWAAMAYCAGARSQCGRSSLAPGRPMWLRSFITSHYGDVFEFWQAVFRREPITYWKDERLRGGDGVGCRLRWRGAVIARTPSEARGTQKSRESFPRL